jgi:Fe-S-cluster containining protein
MSDVLFSVKRFFMDFLYAAVPSLIPQKKELVGRYYKRTGACNQCGKCCKDIHLIHDSRVIDSVETFQTIQKHHKDFQWFIPVIVTDEDQHIINPTETHEDGELVFQCKNLLPDNSCAEYDKRPLFCRKYPSEEGLLMGGRLAEACGYTFEVKKPFTQVLAKTAQPKKGNTHKLKQFFSRNVQRLFP